MRWLINYFRSAFCKHQWAQITVHPLASDNPGQLRGHTYHTHCTKCMYVKKWSITAGWF